jgi:putative transposase
MEDRPMRPSKFTENEIVQALRQVRSGTPAVELCRKLGITQTTFYRWRAKYEGAGVTESGELRELRDENQKLKYLVADLMIGKQVSTEWSGKK